MFKLISTSIENFNLKSELMTPEAGAFNCFEGVVRNHNDDREVKVLEYEVSESLCEKEGDRIIDEARSKFNIINAACYHRVGMLNIGEIAVWIGVTAAHRDDSFKACRYIIDEVKKRLPIWKKEYYADGNSGWINCESSQEKELKV